VNNILVLGAGFVTRPLVAYLLDQPDTRVTMATRTVEKALKVINGHPNGAAVQLNVEDREALGQVIQASDIVISLLPWTYHLDVAKRCLAHRKHLVTTSYVKPEMAALNAEARASGLLFLNEIGVDPGIDHMAAMQVIDGVKEEGGEIERFYSYCGGLPSFSSNNNPFGYKFSWSPSGVLLAATNDGQYLRDGEIVQISSEGLFEHYWLVDVPGAGTFEAYVNRDALPYIDIYGIASARDMYRGTLRNIGHCESWNYFKKIGLLNRERTFDFSTTSPRAVMAALVGGEGTDIAGDIARFLNIPSYAVAIKKLAWLGMLSDGKLPLGTATPFDMFAHLLENKLAYAEGETDLLVQHHAFVAAHPDGGREKITATMVDTGIPGGDSAMSRTVGLPAAIGTRLLMEKKIGLTGVHRPVAPEIYRPVLAELSAMGIRLDETRSTLPPVAG
jgi:saccharopine dehydrogenase-like NADP-dependent oxidoreductase